MRLALLQRARACGRARSLPRWCDRERRERRRRRGTHPSTPTRRISMAESRIVTGLFPDRASAERAYSSVAVRGYGTDDINLVMSDETRNRDFPQGQAVATELGSKAAEGAGIGGAIG